MAIKKEDRTGEKMNLILLSTGDIVINFTIALIVGIVICVLLFFLYVLTHYC